MGSNVHKLIRQEYEKRQRAAFDALEDRRTQIYAKLPRLEEIEHQMNILGVKYNKAILFSSMSSDNAVSELQDKLSKLRMEKEELLSGSGYPLDALEMSYQCPFCKDTGFIGDAGAEKCSCYRQQLINLLYSQSNLKLLDSENFSTFDESVYPEEVNEAKYGLKVSPREYILKIKEKCMNFIENFSSSDEKNLFFSGPTGVGKTFMSNCIAREILNRGYTVLYQTAPVLFDNITEHKKKLFNNDNEYEDEIYNSILQSELLLIDDLGTESPSAARYAELLTILNTRYSNNLTRPCKTIISTNISVKMLRDFYDERVESRIIGSFDMFRFVGGDIRAIKKLQRRL